MKAATVKELKTSLDNATHNELVDYCLQLIKYKKENKELLTYLLYEQNDKVNYIQSVKDALDSLLETINTSQPYFAKKTIRKIIRFANRYIKYSKDAIVELEVHLYLTEKIKALGLALEKNKALQNIYLAQLKKINKVLATLHEDEQYDYAKRIKLL